MSLAPLRLRPLALGWVTVWVTVLVTGLALACSAKGPPARDASGRDASGRDASGDSAASTTGYAAALARLDRELVEAERLARDRDGWADHELVAQLRMSRARLSASFDDWVAAERALDAAFANAPAGGGPRHTRVQLDLALHRLDAAEAGLEALAGAAVITTKRRRELAIGHGELAAQRGELDAARAAFERAAEIGAEPRTITPRLALLDRRGGAYPQARAALTTMADELDGQARAWFLLEAGLVEWTRGDALAALALYDQAEAAFPGWWLIAEHRAEALVALDRADEAEPIYRAVIDQTQNPEFMDALAELLATSGRQTEAETWIRAARAVHDQRIAQLPEAATAHALDHLVQFEPEAAETLARVRAAAEAVPNEDNLARLATVLLAHGQPNAAQAAIERARTNGAASPELDALAARAKSGR